MSLTVKPPPNPNFAQQPMASILKAGLPSATRPPALPSIQYATAAAAAVASTPTMQSPSSMLVATTADCSAFRVKSPTTGANRTSCFSKLDTPVGHESHTVSVASTRWVFSLRSRIGGSLRTRAQCDWWSSCYVFSTTCSTEERCTSFTA